MPTLITTTPQKLRGKVIAKNTTIEATDQEARVLLALGRAKVKPAKEAAKTAVAEPEADKAKRAYKRRDVAESPEQAVVTPQSWTWPKADA